MKLNKIQVERRKQKKIILKRKMVAENRGLGAQLYWLTRNATYFSEQMQFRLKTKKQELTENGPD